MDELSPYELLRLKRVEENRKVLRELGLLESDKPPVIRKSVPKPATPKNRQIVIPAKSNEPRKSRRSIRTRNSTRLSLLAGDDTEFESDSDKPNFDLSEDENSSTVPKSNKVYRPYNFGHIEGIPVGTTWRTRMECSSDGVHRPTVAGIHGITSEGAYSIALSGGYEDDVDFGEGFTYTGSGGRDLKGTAAKPKNLRTAPQSKDQTLEGVNASLAASAETKNPVRVIRGYKLPSVYAPEEGYRYDGLYTVEKFWFATGLSGFQVIKFALKRIKDQAPAPWNEDELNVTETQADRLSRSPSTKENNIVQDDHTVNDIDVAEGIKLATSTYTKEKSPEISKSPNRNSRHNSPKKVINSPKGNLSDKRSSIISPKTVDTKEKHSPKMSFTKKVHNSLQDNEAIHYDPQRISTRNISPKKVCENCLHDNKEGSEGPKTSITLTKTSQLERRNASSRNTSAKKLANAPGENDKSHQDNEVIIQDQKTFKSLVKSPQLERSTTRNTSAKKVISFHCEKDTNLQESEAVLHDQKTCKSPPVEKSGLSKNTSVKNIFSAPYKNGISPKGNETVVQKTSKSPTKTPLLERSVTTRNTSVKKVVSFLCENDITLQDSEAVLLNQKKCKSPQVERSVLSRNTSAKKIDNSLLENDADPQENEGNFKISQNSPKTPGPKRNLSPRYSSPKIINTLIIQENSNNADVTKRDKKILKTAPETLISEINVSSSCSSLKKTYENGMNNEEKNICLKDTAYETSPKSLGSEKNLSFLKVISSVLENETDFKDKKTSKTSPQIFMIEKNVSPQSFSGKRILNNVDVSKDQIGKNKRSKMLELQQQNSPTCISNNSIKIMTQKTEQNGCEHCAKCPSFELDSENKIKKFPILPGQTTILKYFKPPNMTNSLVENNLDNLPTCDEGKNTPSPKKKDVHNKELVVAKSLRGNRRPSLFMVNNFTKHPCSPEFVPNSPQYLPDSSEYLPNCSEDLSANNLSKYEIIQKKEIVKHNFVGDKKTKNLCGGLAPSKKRKSTRPVLESKKQTKDSEIKSLKEVHNVMSPVKKPAKQKHSNKPLRSPATPSSELKIRDCYVRLSKLPEKNNFLGFDDDDIKNTVEQKSRFKKNLKNFENGGKKRASDISEEDTWLGWDTIPSRSIVVNGFLIDKYSK